MHQTNILTGNHAFPTISEILYSCLESLSLLWVLASCASQHNPRIWYYCGSIQDIHIQIHLKHKDRHIQWCHMGSEIEYYTSLQCLDLYHSSLNLVSKSWQNSLMHKHFSISRFNDGKEFSSFSSWLKMTQRNSIQVEMKIKKIVPGHDYAILEYCTVDQVFHISVKKFK